MTKSFYIFSWIINALPILWKQLLCVCYFWFNMFINLLFMKINESFCLQMSNETHIISLDWSIIWSNWESRIEINWEEINFLFRLLIINTIWISWCCIFNNFYVYCFGWFFLSTHLIKDSSSVIEASILTKCLRR